MRRLRALLFRITGLLGRRRRDQELADELHSHLLMHVQDNISADMTPEAARRNALLKLGGIEAIKDRYREQRGIPALETLAQDFRYAARMLRKNPAFTTTAVLTLALGIGANAAIFSFVDAILLRPLPYSDSGNLVQLKEHNRTTGVDFDWASFPNFHDWAEQNSVFEVMAAYKYELLNLTGVDEPQTLLGLRASADGGLILTRFMASLLFEVQSSDRATMESVALMLTSVALLARYIPARRSTRVDPMIALHSE